VAQPAISKGTSEILDPRKADEVLLRVDSAIDQAGRRSKLQGILLQSDRTRFARDMKQCVRVLQYTNVEIDILMIAVL
jgi:hypothetical protein